ncbi:pyridoxal phosphate phosphatase PHOSPHO2 isoform X2 [Pyrgilauda ruficollis]|uniref:pyridoxal phosphate phosphatase PHOSPHO2 isoform X2 n=1 Tax=Pyrgilauda ruficollis TaxID=221976 RepID=UPI001B86C7B1|nr:pyridoxal phosphate phosphatase PHOSPHO2 isoform X2 [Pyrgilauda ruficollis]
MACNWQGEDSLIRSKGALMRLRPAGSNLPSPSFLPSCCPWRFWTCAAFSEMSPKCWTVHTKAAGLHKFALCTSFLVSTYFTVLWKVALNTLLSKMPKYTSVLRSLALVMDI